MLDKAKLRKSTVETVKRTRRTKKKFEEKPTLKISKIDGKYHIEMQVTPEKFEENVEQYDPLIYEIESVNNKSKVKKKERLQKRLVRAAVKEVWSDQYQPDACKMPLEGNFKAIEEEVEAVNSCSCEDDEVSVSCSSSEVNWEIHFTPPLTRYQALKQEKKNELLVNYV